MAIASVSSSPAAERPNWVPAIKQFVRHTDNVVLEPTLAWEGHMIMPGCVVKNEDDRTYYLFYHCSDGKSTSINVATSHDLIHWNKSQKNPILTSRLPWEGTRTTGPDVIRYGERWYMFYEGYSPPRGEEADLGLAVSEDLIRWRRCQDSPIIKRGPAGSWNELRNTHVRVVPSLEEGFFMLHTGRPSGRTCRYHLGVEESTDLIHWQSHPGNPVITCRPGKIEASDPSLVVLEKGYYLVYREEPPARFLAAWSTDFVHWNLIGQVFSIGPAGAWDSIRMDMPYLFREGDRWLLFYGAKGPDGKRRIGVACPRWEPGRGARRFKMGCLLTGLTHHGLAAQFTPRIPCLPARCA